jgi:SAM-dependent methyltransferase
MMTILLNRDDKTARHMDTACPHCSRASSLYLQSQDYNRRISELVFNYYRCPACSLIFLAPIPEDLGIYYPASYYSAPTSLSQIEKAGQRDKHKLDIIKRFASSGRLLEIGPSYGGFAFLAKQSGFEVEVIERDRECCRVLEQVMGVKSVQNEDPVEGIRLMGTFDIIVLWQVLEHLADPWHTIEEASKHLEKGGHLVITTPNPESLQFRLLGRYWTHLDAPRHLSLIPVSLLTEHAKCHNLQRVAFSTKDENALELSRIGWKDSLALMGKRGFFRQRLRTLGSIISMLLSPVERIDGLGSTYSVVFRKEP